MFCEEGFPLLVLRNFYVRTLLYFTLFYLNARKNYVTVEIHLNLNNNPRLVCKAKVIRVKI